VADALAAQSTKGAVTGLDAKTVNNLLYVSPTDGGPAIVAPAVQVSTISEITHLQAKANIEINPNNAPTTASLQYSTDANFTSIVKSINLTPTALDGGAVLSIPVVIDGLLPSTTYYIRATASNESGSFTTPTSSFKSLNPPVTPPTMVANNPTSVTGWSAHLNASVNANNGVTTVSFVYGTDPDFINNTQTGLADVQTVSGNTVRNVGLEISFLKGSTTYYYKVVGSNSAASVQSEVISFTTPAVVGIAPTAETIRPVGGLNTPTTTVTGRINPMGQTTSVRLVYAADQAITVAVKVVNLPSQYTGVDTVTVSADMTGLTPGYRYYYRFEATNAAGFAKPTPLTNTGNPLMPVISNTTGTNQTQTSVTLQTRVNPGASNTRTYFIYGFDPLLETGTTIVQGTPFALTNAVNNSVTYALSGLKPNTTVYFRAKVIAYTGPLAEQGGSMLGPIASVQTLMPVRTPQSITFTLPASRSFVGAPTPLTATATSGLPVTYTTTTPNICQIVSSDSGPVLVAATPIPAIAGAACNVVASQNGDETYAPAVGIGKTINFLKLTQSIAFTTPPNRDLNTLNPLTVSTSSGLNVTLASSTPATCSVIATSNGGYAAQAVPGIPADTSKCTIVASQAGDDRYAPATVTRTFTWTRTGTNLNATWTTPITVDGSALNVLLTILSGDPLSESATGSTPLTFTSLTPGICRVGTVEYLGTSTSHSRATIKAIWNGTCQVAVSFGGNATYLASGITSTSSISGLTAPQPGANALQSISIVAPLSSAFGTTVPVTTRSTSGLPVVVTTTTPAICTVSQNSSGAYFVTSAAGLSGDINSCVLKGTQAGDDRWAASTGQSTINWRRPYVNLRGTWTTPFSSAGSVFNVVINDLAGLRIDETTTGTTPIRITTLTPKVCLVEGVEYVGSTTSHTKATIKALWNGTCQLSVASAGNSFLVATTTTISTQISGITTPQPGAAALQTIAFSPQMSAPFGTTIQLVAKATSLLPVVITTTTPTICTVTQGSDGAYSVTSAAGLQGDNNVCTLQANQSGDTRWSSAPTVTRSIRWSRLPQSITFIAASSRYYGGAPTVLTATSTSGLPVSFSTNTPAVCKIDTVDSQTVVNYVLPIPSASSSYCYVTASQAGNGTYNTAPTSTRGIMFRKENTIVIGTWSGAITPAGTTVDLLVKSAVQPALNESLAGTNALVVTSATPNICKVLDVKYVGTSTSHTQANVKGMWNGNCQLVATFAGNGYWLGTSSSIARGITGMTTPEPGANVPQSLSMSAPTSTEIGAVTPITSSAGSKLAVTLKSLTPNICTVSTTSSAFAVTTAAGVVGNGNICTIEASQAGDDRWAAAKTITRNITINKASISVRLSRLSTIIVGKTSALFVIENRFINSSMNNGRNSIGHISTAVSNTPAICSVSNVSPYELTSGTHTQFTVTGVANGSCSVTFGYAGSDTQNSAYRTQAITVTGVK
jgi:phosphodiesterase/alkaline phosphatase D-like protein